MMLPTTQGHQMTDRKPVTLDDIYNGYYPPCPPCKTCGSEHLCDCPHDVATALKGLKPRRHPSSAFLFPLHCDRRNNPDWD